MLSPLLGFERTPPPKFGYGNSFLHSQWSNSSAPCLVPQHSSKVSTLSYTSLFRCLKTESIPKPVLGPTIWSGAALWSLWPSPKEGNPEKDLEMSGPCWPTVVVRKGFDMFVGGRSAVRQSIFVDFDRHGGFASVGGGDNEPCDGESGGAAGWVMLARVSSKATLFGLCWAAVVL